MSSTVCKLGCCRAAAGLSPVTGCCRPAAGPSPVTALVERVATALVVGCFDVVDAVDLSAEFVAAVPAVAAAVAAAVLDAETVGVAELDVAVDSALSCYTTISSCSSLIVIKITTVLSVCLLT